MSDPDCVVRISKEELENLKAEHARFKKALVEIAVFYDAINPRYLDEPHSASIARKALKGNENG
jgi:hypothetical protein